MKRLSSTNIGHCLYNSSSAARHLTTVAHELCEKSLHVRLAQACANLPPYPAALAQHVGQQMRELLGDAHIAGLYEPIGELARVS